MAAPPPGPANEGQRNSKDRAPYLDTRGSLSFDPHPIDRLALSCLLIEGVALPRLPAPPPTSMAAGEQV